MITAKLRSVLVLLPALSLAGCMVEADYEDGPVSRDIRSEVTVTFESPAAAEAAALSLERMDDGTMVLALADDGSTLEVLATTAAESWLLANPTLVTMDEPAPAKDQDKGAGSCIGYCGEWAEVCGCDAWCVIFGDCCFDYYEVC